MIKDNFIDKTIVIPLHVPLNYPCDYINQTAKVLSQNNFIIYLDYHYPYPWQSFLQLNNLKIIFNSIIDISKSKKIVYFRAPSLLPFSKFKSIWNLNKEFGFFMLSIFLWIFKRKVIVWQFYSLITKKIFKNQFFFYDCIDYMNLKDETSSFFYKEKRLFKISNLVSFNSKGLFERKLKKNPILAQKTIITVCGCNNILLSSEVNKIPREYININKKIVVFMGVFNFRVDVDLLKYVVINNKSLQFIFIGPIRESVANKFKDVLKEKNVLYLGEKEKDKLPSYLRSAHLGIIPYIIKSDFVKYSNPMKAYEYLSSGLPVVSTKIFALDNYPKDIVYTTDNKKDFSKAISRIIDNWDNKKAKIARDIAEKNSWENKIRIIEKFIINNEKTN